MSEKNVKAFFEKLEADKELQNKLKALGKKYKAQRDALVSEMIALAASAGYDFTVDDFIEAREKTAAEASKAELKPIGMRQECGTFDLVFWAPCTCGYSKPCNSQGLA